MAIIDAVCPACGSHDTKRAEMVWRAGNSESVTDGAVGDFGGDFITGSTWSTSDLAASVAPPEPSPVAGDVGRHISSGCLGMAGWIIAGGIACAALAAFPILIAVVLVICLAGACVHFFRLLAGAPKKSPERMAAEEDHQHALAEWRKLWLCLRCGARFTPNKSG